MSQFRLARPALEDLRSIRRYTRRRWGDDQARRYLTELDECFHMLAENPKLGRQCDDIRPGLLRRETGRHVVFFRLEKYGIRIVRVLHERMLPQLHLRQETDE
jgi:toxin ParE1/3/4